VVIGVPLPRGFAPERTSLALTATPGGQLPCDATTLDRWADGSSRWVLLAFRTDAASQVESFTLQPAAGAPPEPANPVRVTREGDAIVVETGALGATLGPGTGLPLRSVRGVAWPWLDAEASGLAVTLPDGSRPPCTVDTVSVELHGDVRAVVAARGRATLPGDRRLEVDWRLEFWAGLPSMIVHLTVRNPHRAQHPDGYWELGDPGSILLKSVEFRLSSWGPASAGPRLAYCSAEPDQPQTTVPLPFELYQDSSGGENWRSRNHQNREGRVPVRFRGYRRSDQPDREILRATPVVTLQTPAGPLSMALRHFWQNFPKAFEVDDHGITLGLWPKQWDDLHELQGGEQKTHTFAISFGDDGVTESPLHWFREPLVPTLDPQWVSETRAVPYLMPAASAPLGAYESLVNAAIDGDDTFERKREVVDEYGWRHFGDIWGDHEAVFPVDPATPQPLISHYNNQYDQVAGFCRQWLRSGDPRWWRQFVEGAPHVADIDVYHTDEDKSAYNHGLFWHTYHYVDAHRSTHRSYPRVKGPNGGGPANEQNYPAGLMLHYFLTGDTNSRDAAIGLARFVIDMDDGSRTIFKWLASGDTGRASQSRSEDYHGPGRGSGNSLNALLVGHQLTGDPRLLGKAEQLVKRCVHPEQDLEALTLLDAENRWFYTMFLQSLGRYLDHKAELGQLDDMYAYGRATLLHYARWMAQFEYPFLEKPEILEYPTETWVAQDMRKCEVFQLASRHARGEERARFQERARFFFDYVTRTLPAMPTRTLCRPVVLLMSYGYSRAWFAARPDATAPDPTPHAGGWGPHPHFVPQKSVAMKRAKMLFVVGATVAIATAGILTILVFG
jgi:hypothetical protein